MTKFNIIAAALGVVMSAILFSNIALAQGLSGASLEACQAREAAIKQRSGTLLDTAKTILIKFNAIAERVQDYYNLKVTPSGKTVSNYAALLQDIQAKKSSVETALSSAQSSLAGFSCTTDDPKALITQFGTDMQNVITSLQDYRISIKNLIKGVHSVTGVQNSAI